MDKEQRFLGDTDSQEAPGRKTQKVPENLMGATHWEELREAETKIGGLRAWDVMSHQKHIPGDFDADHLARIHGYVTKDLYPVVGETRADTILLDEEEKKTNKDFVGSEPSATRRTGLSGESIVLPAADTVNNRLDMLSKELAEANFLRGLEKPDFVERFTETYTKYAQTHAFEQGNGPVLVAAMGLLAERAGYHVELDRVPGLQRETDALLANGEAGSPLRLRAAIGQHVEESQTELGEVSRRITLQVVKPKPPPELVAENTRLALVQAVVPFIDRQPGPESNELRSSLKAVYQGDDSHTHLSVIRQAVRSQNSPEMRPALARVEAAATQVDTNRQERQNGAGFQQQLQSVRAAAVSPERGEITR